MFYLIRDTHWRRMRRGRERRAELLEAAKEGTLHVNCAGGIGIKDPDLRNLIRRRKLRLERRQIGTLWPSGNPKRRTYAVLV